MEREILFREDIIELEILEFKAGNKFFGIDIRDVREILHYEEGCTPIPNSHPYIEGMVKPRDFIIPIVNVRKALNLPEENNKFERYDVLNELDILKDINMLIVTNINDMNIGLLVEGVERIRRITNKEISRPEKHGNTSFREAVLGTFTNNGKEIEIIEFRNVFSKINPDIEFVR